MSSIVTSSGWGTHWGYLPWGAALYLEEADLFCFEGCTGSAEILSAPFVTRLGDAVQFIPYYPEMGSSCGLAIHSGRAADGLFPQTTAALQAVPESGGVPNQWTLEWRILLERVPFHFGDLAENHLYVGAANDDGPVAGVFVSAQGLAYAGDVVHQGPNNTLILNGPIQPIAGTAHRVPVGQYLTFRLAVDGVTGLVYLYVTPTADVARIGHQLAAILPALGTSGLVHPVIDRALISVKGTTVRPTNVVLQQWCMSSRVQIPNLPPIAIAGPDQAVRVCNILRLDGSASFDPEGAPLSYRWELVDAPPDSAFSISGFDGSTLPQIPPSGVTQFFYSSSLGALHDVDPIVPGDVLRINEHVYPILSMGIDVNGFYVELPAAYLPDSLASASFRILRQRGISNADEVRAAFLPDISGFYRFQLTVHDGMLFSLPNTVVVNAVETVLPRAITPDLSFLFHYLPDFWGLVEGMEKLEVFWGSLAQVAASELWTLWQLEYSKSIRDIQRTFTRRWLHYDLVLGEPLPELTTLRLIQSGVTSVPVVPGSLPALSGLSVSISSPVFGEATVPLYDPRPSSMAQARFELESKLQLLDPRFSVDLLEYRDGTEAVRLRAPFPFEVTDSSFTPFVEGQRNGLLSGSGLRVGPRSFQTGVCLQDLVTENDLLVLGDATFVIAAVIDDPADDVPFQRLLLKQDLPLVVGEDWIIPSTVTSQLLDFHSGLVTRGDRVTFEVADRRLQLAETALTRDLVGVPAVGVSEDRPSTLGIDAANLLDYPLREDFSVVLGRVVRCTHIPVHELVVGIPTLTRDVQIEDDQATLHANVDYFLEKYRGKGCIRFVSGVSGGPSVWEGDVPPDRLWAEYTSIDNRPRIESNFGLLVEFTLDDLKQLPDTVDYLSAVQGMWTAYMNGPTLSNLRMGTQILLGLPFVEAEGVIEEIRTDFSQSRGRMLVRDLDRPEIVRSYSFDLRLELETNPDTGQKYSVGDVVHLYAPLVTGVEILDWVKDPKWMEGFVRQGILYEVEKFHRFLVRVDSRAFNLSALMFARNFLLKIKPRHTYPILVVRYHSDESEIDITDRVRYRTRLHLDDAMCMPFSSHIYDDVRSGGGKIWNQFDSAQGEPPPTYPDSVHYVDWAYDRFVLCPHDSVELGVCAQHPGGPMTYDSVFAYDTPVLQRLETEDVGPFTVPAGSTGIVLTANGLSAIQRDGDITRIQLFIVGGPGADDPDYEVVVLLNGSPVATEAFLSQAEVTELVFTTSVVVQEADTITFNIRHGGGSARNPDWTLLEVGVDAESVVWTYDDDLPEAKYCAKKKVA